MVGAKDYLEAKGGRVDRAAEATPAVRGQAPELRQEQIEHIKELRADLHQHLPEMEPFIKELYALGMVDGWRCLKEVTVFNRLHVNSLRSGEDVKRDADSE